MAAEVCSIYIKRPWRYPGADRDARAQPGGGRAHPAAGRAKASSGCAPPAARVMNLADAQNHPRFAYRPGNRRGAVCLHPGRAGPPRRPDGGRGRRAEPARRDNTPPTRSRSWKPSPCCWPSHWRRPARRTGPRKGCRDCPARVPGCPAGRRYRHRPDRAARRPLAPGACWPTNPAAELDRLHAAAERMQRGLDELLDGQLPGWHGRRGCLARGDGGVSAGRRRCRLAAPGRTR